MVIDSHHHFWRYNEDEYGWIPLDWSSLRRDFLPADLAGEIAYVGVDGVVSVQARQSLAETEWLLDFAARHPFVRGVVGWVPLTSPYIDSHLDRLAAHSAASAGKLVAFRHVLQGESDDAYMLRDDFTRGIRALTRRGLAYDILIFPRHLPNTCALVDHHPDQVFILDHLAKPRVAGGEFALWSGKLRELARRPNIACKLSGLVTEADVKTWTPALLHPYFDAALSAFGPKRLLFGSDWPVCLAGVTYADWKALVDSWLAALSHSDRSAILGENACRLYRLPLPLPR